MLCFTFLLSHKIRHVSNNLYWQHVLLQILFVAMPLGSMFRYRNLKLKMSDFLYIIPYIMDRPNLFFLNYSLSTKTTVIWTVWLCSISRASSVLWISIRTTIQPVLNKTIDSFTTEINFHSLRTWKLIYSSEIRKSLFYSQQDCPITR